MELYGYEFIRESDLTHHGIKGQKWGVRRFQNEDGTLTAVGKKHYGNPDVFNKKQAKKAAYREYSDAFDKAYSKNYQIYSLNKEKRAEKQRQWDEAAEKADAYRKAKQDYAAAKSKMLDDRKEAKVANKYERRGVSSEKAKEVGRLYVERQKANKKYRQAYDKVQRTWPIGKKYKARVDEMVESLNDYWIADDNYRISKIQANAEARRSKGWR